MKPIILMSTIVLATATPLLAADKSYDFAGFSKVAVRGDVDVEVHAGGDYRVDVSVSRRSLLRRLEFRQEGDTLVIERRRGGSFFLMGLADRYEVVVALPELAAVTAQSGADVEVDGTLAPEMVAKASSGADLELTGVAAQALSLTASSGAEVSAEGICGMLTAAVSSGAEIEAEHLICAEARLQASSGGDLEAHATESARAAASSGGDIRLHGNAPLSDVRESSGGDVRPAS